MDNLNSMSHGKLVGLAHRLEATAENNKEKAKAFGKTALHVGEVAVGAFGCGFVRARWGMPQIAGRDASLVVGLAAVISGIAFPNVKGTEDAMYLGVGMLAEKTIDYGRQAGTPSNKAGANVAGYLPASTVSAENGWQQILAARAEMAHAGRGY